MNGRISDPHCICFFITLTLFSGTESGQKLVEPNGTNILISNDLSTLQLQTEEVGSEIVTYSFDDENCTWVIEPVEVAAEEFDSNENSTSPLNITEMSSQAKSQNAAISQSKTLVATCDDKLQLKWPLHIAKVDVEPEVMEDFKSQNKK